MMAMFWLCCGMIAALFILGLIWYDGQRKCAPDQIVELEFRDFLFVFIVFWFGPLSLLMIVFGLIRIVLRRFDSTTPPYRYRG
jgi:hypothetical protein